MRQLAAAALEVPASGFKYLSRFVRRSLKMQLASPHCHRPARQRPPCWAPDKQVDAKAPLRTTRLPNRRRVRRHQQRDRRCTYVLEFTRPMNEDSVADSLTIKPAVPVKLVWDSAAQTLSITPPQLGGVHSYSIQVAGSAMDQSGMQLGTPVSASS